MDIFGLFKKDNSSSIAKDRLTMVLSYERKGLPPNFAEALKEDMVNVFSKYPQFDAKSIEVELKKNKKSDNNRKNDELWISIPFVSKDDKNAKSNKNSKNNKNSESNKNTENNEGAKNSKEAKSSEDGENDEKPE